MVIAERISNGALSPVRAAVLLQLFCYWFDIMNLETGDNFLTMNCANGSESMPPSS